MTDLTPNDLSHLSDEEFNALCSQGEHAPGAEPLSSFAQAVHDAAHEAWITKDDPRSIAIATLRAAADQVVPEENVDEADYDCLHAKWAAQGKQKAREAFLAIATELENQ